MSFIKRRVVGPNRRLIQVKEWLCPLPDLGAAEGGRGAG